MCFDLAKRARCSTAFLRASAFALASAATTAPMWRHRTAFARRLFTVSGDVPLAQVPKLPVDDPTKRPTGCAGREAFHSGQPFVFSLASFATAASSGSSSASTIRLPVAFQLVAPAKSPRIAWMPNQGADPFPREATLNGCVDLVDGTTPLLIHATKAQTLTSLARELLVLGAV